MSEAVFVQKGAAIDYTPTEAAVDAGDIVFLANNYAGVAEFPIAQNAMGSLAVTGIFKCAKDGNAIAAGALLYWNTDKAQAGAVSNKYLGRAAIAAAETDPYVYFFLNAPNIGAFTAIDPQPSPEATQVDISAFTAVNPAAITAVNPDAATAAPGDADTTKLIADVASIRTQLTAAIADITAVRTEFVKAVTDFGTVKTALNAAKADLAAVVTALKTAGALT
jgi:predicted RecA/RadA family phage recombinase